MDAKALEQVWLFASLRKDELQKLAGWTDEVSVEEGLELAKPGQFAREFFVILDGTAEVHQDGCGVLRALARRLLGEIGLLETQQR